MSDKINFVKGLFDKKNTIPDKEILHVLNWKEIRELSNNPLVTIGCHTLNHLNLSALSKDHMSNEIVESQRQLSEKIKKPIHHFAFPFGTRQEVSSRELEFMKETKFKFGNLTLRLLKWRANKINA